MRTPPGDSAETVAEKADDQRRLLPGDSTRPQPELHNQTETAVEKVDAQPDTEELVFQTNNVVSEKI